MSSSLTLLACVYVLCRDGSVDKARFVVDSWWLCGQRVLVPRGMVARRRHGLDQFHCDCQPDRRPLDWRRLRASTDDGTYAGHLDASRGCIGHRACCCSSDGVAWTMLKVGSDFPPSPFPLHFPSFPLKVPPLNPARGLGSAVSYPSGVWGGVPAEIELGTF